MSNELDGGGDPATLSSASETEQSGSNISILCSVLHQPVNNQVVYLKTDNSKVQNLIKS